MIPGALGSFDVMMILGLSNLGVDREIIVLWLLLYRLFYYIIPFLIGCLFFTKHLSQKLDTHYRQLLKQIGSGFTLFFRNYDGAPSHYSRSLHSSALVKRY